MALAFTALGSSNSRPSTARFEDRGDSDALEPPSSARASLSHPRIRTSFSSSPSLDFPDHSGTSFQSDFLSAPQRPNASSISLVSSTDMNTPIPSRSSSPLPPFYSFGMSSASSSDSDSDPGSPTLGATLLGGIRRDAWLQDEQHRWWRTRGPEFPHPRRGYRRFGFRTVKRSIRKIIRHPLFPIRPIPILLTLLLFTLLAISITLLLMYILNPDKEPLPWRAYCSAPSISTKSRFLNSSPYDPFAISSGPSLSHFPPDNLDSLPPAGVFIGVFSMDSSFERRMLVRTTWASHPRSRVGAGEGDGGNGTSRTVIRFILGQPRREWERRVQLEIEKYHDIVILPIAENMNAGKSHAFFTWAATGTWVPPLYFDTDEPLPRFSYSNVTVPPPPLAQHDPSHAWVDHGSSRPRYWVRPDFVVKADDDSFVMVAELEARMRVQLHEKSARVIQLGDQTRPIRARNVPSAQPGNDGLPEWSGSSSSRTSREPSPSPDDDPLIYWGYLVKKRFMAGELYALSWSLVDWVSKDPAVKGSARGAEDKQTSKWMRLHPRADDVWWASERCWMYDHPRSGTVYSHGFLFPSEAARVRRGIMAYFDKTPQDLTGNSPSVLVAPTGGSGNNAPIPPAWSRSTVSSFGRRYSAPLSNLTILQSVEALVEGSDMSLLNEGAFPRSYTKKPPCSSTWACDRGFMDSGSILTAEDAWSQREGRKTRYEGKRVGGTVVVHFIKKNMWYLETALALLEGDEKTERDKQRERAHAMMQSRPVETSRHWRHHRRR
ncbi:hypothetical protein EW146_g1480 [Bondarzewia mesenterica]|uniref:Glycosyltransferase family 31 protein n=1 Tax=Bondarzewia mesenterica TaxID=1095465 RepID=A0A4S4M3R5_9AGAM|nr:hypothetical protein EW146_g1480 [Bondarzewia mesenterica]